ncbi:hypothetical protein [Nosocomiicoccus sp. HMSC09A07]|uniref:hypothetical protein n=1 Tax=Nosocomiicoccus sp. HMSC09A07 TaxID=1581145 RepID=UPI0008A2806B|nr:hypothetical protein [Nosocomiicoccus sp. HMSC09A07]OFS62297.1 hypothetical protein HMPREF3177_06015 [Nosocomiicoccus sp. HMSC09A07]
MSILNKELSKRLNVLDEDAQQLLRPFLTDLVNANTRQEEASAKRRFEKSLNEHLKLDKGEL